MAKKIQRGLGRGLGALLGEDVVALQAEVKSETVPVQDAAPVDAVRDLPIYMIDPNPDQPRRTFDEDALRELAASIESVGVIQPIVVCETDGRYRIIAGERRYRACRMAGLEMIPAIVRNWDQQRQLEAALIENLQRDDLNAIEEARGVRRLMEEGGLTQERAAERLGKSRSALANLLRLLTLEDAVQQMVIDGKLSAGHARALAGVDRRRQVQLANLTVQQGWSVRQLERICAQPENKPGETPAPARRPAELGQRETMAREVFGTRVKLDGDENKGKITLSYMSAEDLERIWDVLEFIRQSEQ